MTPFTFSSIPFLCLCVFAIITPSLADCDPCDETCIANKRSVSNDQDHDDEIQVVYGNETAPFWPGHSLRMRLIPRQLPQLEFDCTATSTIKEVCVRLLFHALFILVRRLIASIPAKYVLCTKLSVYFSVATSYRANAQYIRQVQTILQLSHVQSTLQRVAPHANRTRAVLQAQIAAAYVSIRSY